MSSAWRLGLTLGILLTLADCSLQDREACRPDTGARGTLVTLFFGRAIRGRADVTDAEWLAFLNDTVTPALPGGYTVTDATGAWLDPRTRQTSREAAKVLVTALPDTPASLDAVQRLRAAYRQRFHQQLVGMTVQPVCASF